VVVLCAAVIQLIRREDTALLGLVLLNTASEELACPRDDLVAARKHQLHLLMLHEVPAVLAVLNGRPVSVVCSYASVQRVCVVQTHARTHVRLMALCPGLPG